jgi:hypothetical protein
MLPADDLEHVPSFDSMFLGAVDCLVFRMTLRWGARRSWARIAQASIPRLATVLSEGNDQELST